MVVRLESARFRAKMRALANNIENVAIEMLDTLAEITQTNAKSSRAFVTRSPNNGLRANIITEKQGNFVRTVKANKHYAKYVEYGNDPGGGYIYPVRAKALRFANPTTGEMMFRKRVKAAKPRPYMQPSFQLVSKLGPKLLQSRMARFLESTR